MARGFHFLTALAILLISGGCGDNTTGNEITDQLGPDAPEWVYVASTSPTGITLNWDDISTLEAGYYIERATSAGGTFSIIDTLSNSDADDGVIETYTDSAVELGATYFYRIKCWDSIGRDGEPSKPVVWGVAAENQTPEIPTAVFPESNTSGHSGEMTVQWDCQDPDGDDLVYEVFFGDSQIALESKEKDYDQTSLLVSSDLTLTYYYYWRVLVRDSNGASALSPIWNFGTVIERVDVPEGYFIQGDCGLFNTADPEEFCYSENPVYVEAFEIDKYEVSNQQYSQFLQMMFDRGSAPELRVVDGMVYSLVGDTLMAALFPDGDDNSNILFNPDQGVNGLFTPRPGKENHPVIEVTWFGANRFARFHNRRLPQEPEWEKAARGTTSVNGQVIFTIEDVETSIGYGNMFPWGSDLSAAYFNFNDSGDPFETRVGVGTTPCGFYNGGNNLGFSTQSNASDYGAYDMAGNVAEWCHEDFLDYDTGTNKDLKVIKGGTWRGQRSEATGYWRSMFHPDETDNSVGFRTVKSLSP